MFEREPTIWESVSLDSVIETEGCVHDVSHLPSVFINAKSHQTLRNTGMTIEKE